MQAGLGVLLLSGWVGGAFATPAEDVARLAGVDRGVFAIVGSVDPALPADLAAGGRSLVYVQSPSAQAIARVRARLYRQGLLGTAGYAEVATSDRLPFADGLVDAIVVPEATEGLLDELPATEVARVLRPGGVAVVGGEVGRGRLDEWGECDDLTGEVVEQEGPSWLRLTRRTPSLIDEWTHWQHGPDNNPVSTDAAIRAPYITQFLSLPYYSPMPSISVIAGGVQFRATGHMAIHEREERFLNTLFATSARNGTLLWTRPLRPGYLVHRSLCVATPEVLYLLEPKRCVMLDPQTGAEEGALPLPPDLADRQFQWLALQDGLLHALVGEDQLEAEIVKRKRATGAWGWDELSQGYYAPDYPWGYGSTLIAWDAQTKQEVWRHTEPTPIDSRALCMTRDRLFIHGERAYVAALEARTGKPLWRTEDARLLADIAEANDQGLGFKTTPYALCTPEALFLAGRGRRNVVAVRAADGAHLWTVPGGYNSTNLLFSGGALYAHIPSAMRLDPLTGALTQELGISKRSCARFTGCPEALFHRGSLNVGEGTTRYDLSAARASVLHAFRPPCNDGVIPAEGLLHITQWDCDCNLQLMGGIALAPVGGLEVNRLATDAERLQVLRSAGVPPAAFAIDPADWTTYRGDNERGACSTATVPQTVRPLWQAAAGCPSRPSAPTAAGGLVFVAGDDGQVRALDGSSGDERWRFPAGGAVRLPPSVWEGRAYVGSADGYVTCLEAASGKPLWRFRAAPYDRRTVIYGRLSSTWPVNTGVLVQDGVAYAGAGIINYDGTHVYALDARSGRLRWQNNTSGHLNPELRAGVSIQGGLALAPWALLLAGGNVTSPAQYALQDGHSLNDPPGPAPPHANRGSEVGVVHGRYALIGGPRLFTDPQDTISTTTGYGILGPDVAPGKGLPGRVPPAWGQGAVVLAAGGPVVCVDAGEFDAWLKVEDKKARMPWRWKAEAPRASVAAAITANAVVAVGRAADDQWCVAALDLAAGKELWVQPLPQAPVAGGLCIDREGRVVVTLSDGSVVCFG